MIPANAQQLDRTGYSVIPGLVGMHNHLFYAGSISLQRSPKDDVEEPGLMAVELAYTAPRLIWLPVLRPCAPREAWSRTPISKLNSASMPARCRAPRSM